MKIRPFLKVLFFAAAVLYPPLIFYFLVIRKTPPRLFSLFVMAFALCAFIARTSGKKKGAAGSLVWTSLLLFAVGALCLLTNSAVVLKFYPLLMNVLLLAAFGITVFFPPSMIFRFAALQDKTIKGSLAEQNVTAYCRRVTVVWCGFFVLNGGIAAWTIFSGSDFLWSVYNGGVSYILMGVLFAGEFIIRKKVQKKMPRAVPLSAFDSKSRSPQAVICYEGEWSRGVYRTWGDFLAGTAALRRKIADEGGDAWLLYCDDYWYFLLAFTALLQCKKEILLSANISPAYIAEISGGAPFLTDKVFAPEEQPPRTVFIPAVVDQAGRVDESAPEEWPAIAADDTVIVMYTSGSTGKPKAVRQRLTEFEADNAFVLSKWGNEFLSRKLCATVSQHHIYGLLFAVLLPFTAGVPFRRQRIQFPEELETLTDTGYVIVTVPAFLKRAVEIENRAALTLQSPWIFTSGGVLDRETARKTGDVFGFWPVEVYGSTETSGIAWRQSVNGPEWTPFDNAGVSVNSDGCLVIRSPYIKDPAGFQTADLADILPDGRFLLKGRIDSVVKIEEKRISLPEIESRIMESGLAADCWVTALEDRRQYLAAAVVLNGKGKAYFDGRTKFEINTFWREYLSRYFENTVIPKKWRYPDTLPLDAQGKKKKEELVLLFAGRGSDEIISKTVTESESKKTDNETVIEKTENTVTVDCTIPPDSSYFDGHFPGFPILPAVAQMDIVLCFARRYLREDIAVSEIRRIKFTSLVRPLAPLRLRIELNEKMLSFKMSSPDGTLYSSGTLKLRETGETAAGGILPDGSPERT